MLTEGEIHALTALHGEQTLSALATNLDHVPRDGRTLGTILERNPEIRTRCQVRPSHHGDTHERYHAAATPDGA